MRGRVLAMEDVTSKGTAKQKKCDYLLQQQSLVRLHLLPILCNLVLRLRDRSLHRFQVALQNMTAKPKQGRKGEPGAARGVQTCLS